MTNTEMRGIKQYDIVSIKSHLTYAQPALFPEGGFMIVLRTRDGIFDEPPGDRILHVLSHRRGNFVIDATSCQLEIKSEEND